MAETEQQTKATAAAMVVELDFAERGAVERDAMADRAEAMGDRIVASEWRLRAEHSRERAELIRAALGVAPAEKKQRRPRSGAVQTRDA